VVVDGLAGHDLHHPFTHVAIALVHSLAGDVDLALEHVQTVVSLEGATYLDLAIAAVAAAGAWAAKDDADRVETVLDDALTGALKVGDVVAVALLQSTYVRVLGRPHTSGAGDEAALGSGWRQVVSALPTVERVP
jgi:hypothetical protein